MATMNSAARSYLKEFGGAMIAYAIVLPISISLIEAHPHAPWRIPVALAPVVPAALALWAFVRWVRRADELQRRIQFEALAVAFGATGLLTFSYGFLENVGFPQLSFIWVFPFMIALWGLTVAVTSYRYR
jgi:hypothetical protein